MVFESIFKFDRLIFLDNNFEYTFRLTIDDVNI